MAFANRDAAGELLAERLAQYRGQHPLVLAIPRGAVPMARIIADALGGELDVVLVRKLRAPDNPELAVGSIDEAGTMYLDPGMRGLWDERYMRRERHAQLDVLHHRRRLYQASGAALDPADRTVIVVDDGIATGSTMVAALRAVRARRPRRLIAATAVASREALHLISAEADEVVCLETPPVLVAVGHHFSEFAQVSDEDVMATLATARRPPAAGGVA